MSLFLLQKNNVVLMAGLIPMTGTFVDLTEVHVLTLKDFGPGNDPSVDIWAQLLSRMPSLRSICMQRTTDPGRGSLRIALKLWNVWDDHGWTRWRYGLLFP